MKGETMGISRLGYIGMNVRDLGVVETVLGRVLGMQPRRGGDGDALSYRMDERHHRFTFIPAARDSLAYVGWEVDSLEALHRLAERIGQKGVSVTRGSVEEKSDRAVFELFSFRGHTVLGSADPDAAVRFYRETLGFEISDYVHWDIARVTFLHCNPRHHSLAVMNACYGTEPGQMNHLMVEAQSLDDVGRGYDLVRELEVPLVLTLGKHSNDHMTSFYIHMPGGWAIEYGYGGREIDADWEVKYYDSPRLWGHHLQSPAAPPR